MRNRAKEVEAEWRRMERRDRWHNIWCPLIGMSIGGSILFAISQYTVTGKVLMALLGAIGLPLMLWLGRKK